MPQTCERCGSAYEGPGCNLCGATLISHAPADPWLGKTVGGRYQVLRKLGQGGMGSVYLAEQIGIGHKVALKFLNAQLVGRPELAQRFLNEARTYARIAHPHAVTFHDFGQDASGNLYISMEYIEGPDLKTLLDQQGRLALAEAVEISLQVADALEHAHSRGVIHRDLKPENVIVRHGLRGPHAKVLDFGIAKLLGDPAANLTVEGGIAGTPQYMPPEQIHGTGVDARADVYVLAVVLFELLTGLQPFGGATVPEMLYKQVNERMPLLASVSPTLALPGLDELLQKATSKDREQRHPSMASFADELLQVTATQEYRAAMANSLPAGAPAKSPGDPGGTWVRGPGAPKGDTPPVAEEPIVAPVTLPVGAVELSHEPPPERRRSRGSLILGGGTFVLIALAAGGWLLHDAGALQLPLLPVVETPAAPAVPEAPVEPPTPAAPAKEAAAEPPPKPPEDDGRARLLATEIMLKANAEFVAGNLDGARAILATVPDHESVRVEAAKLDGDIAQIQKKLGSASRAAGRGDCRSAIRIYGEILSRWPGVKEAAAGRARCRQMLPPDLAE